jgi:hypothetical protein
MKNRKEPDFNLGLVLTGEDARRFHEYMEDPSPTFTKEGRKLIREAQKLYEREEARIKRGLELLEREERQTWDPPV